MNREKWSGLSGSCTIFALSDVKPGAGQEPAVSPINASFLLILCEP